MGNVTPSKDSAGPELDILLVIPWFGIGLTGGRFATLGAEFPFSIAMLMTNVEQHGFRASLLDTNLERDPLAALEREIKRRRPKIVGITSYSATIAHAERIAQKVKQVDDSITVILGGFHATAEPAECLNYFDGFDYVVHGEGELALIDLLDRLLNHKPTADTPNLAFRDGGQVVINPQGPIIHDLDELPFPDIDRTGFRRYEPTPPNYYSLPTIGIMASRGCPYKCTFCATHFQWNKTMRRMSRGLLVDWLEKFATDWGVRDFRFFDDTFTVPKKEVVEFCEEVLRRGLKIHWNCYSRVDTIDKELARLMKRAGCYHVKFGIEAGTQESLDRIRKNITLERAREAIAEVASLGIETKASFILGIHEESLAQSRATVDFALSLDLDYATFSIMMIFPGSEDYAQWKAAGRIPDKFKWDKPIYSSPHEIEELRSMLKQAYRRFYLRPRFALGMLSSLVHDPVCQFNRVTHLAKHMVTPSPR
jgi:radical SAM superfamily enzyme YgiQ (UPF0313 family)